MNSLDTYLLEHESIMGKEAYELLFEMSYVTMRDEAMMAFEQKLKNVFWANDSLMLLHKSNQDFIMVTHSAQEVGKIQRTFFKNRVPCSHQTYDSLEDCIKRDANDWLTEYKIMTSI